MRPPICHSILKFFCFFIFEIIIPLQFLQAQWISQTANWPENLVDIVMLDSLKAIAIGDRNAILRTTDAGSTWFNETAAVSAIFNLRKISFSDAYNGAIVGEYQLMSTTDGGIKWQGLTVPRSRQLCLSIMQTGPASIFVGTDSGWVYSTSDTGKTWISEKISAWPIRTFFAWRGPSIVGVSKYAITPHSLCIQYVIPSPSWGEVILPYFQGLGSEAFDAEYCNGGGSGFIVGVFGDLWSQPAIVRRSMTDTAWNSLSTGIMDAGPLYGVSAPSANVIYVCGSGGRIYKTINGGDTWKKLPAPTTRNLHAIYFFNEKHGFAVGDSGTILYTSNGGDIVVGVKENENNPTEFVLNQNYPNPFNSLTTISFFVGTHCHISLRIYDLLGREVVTLVNEDLAAGKYSQQWNASNMPSGIYFYRMQAGNFIETKNLILLR
jgi:photosystem II stability/assembly factor-like uncharacterized protein